MQNEINTSSNLLGIKCGIESKINQMKTKKKQKAREMNKISPYVMQDDR